MDIPKQLLSYGYHQDGQADGKLAKKAYVSLYNGTTLGGNALSKITSISVPYAPRAMMRNGLLALGL